MLTRTKATASTRTVTNQTMRNSCSHGASTVTSTSRRIHAVLVQQFLPCSVHFFGQEEAFNPLDLVLKYHGHQTASLPNSSSIHWLLLSLHARHLSWPRNNRPAWPDWSRRSTVDLTKATGKTITIAQKRGLTWIDGLDCCFLQF